LTYTTHPAPLPGGHEEWVTQLSNLSVPLTMLAVVVGYLTGSIPFGLILTRWAGLGDVREIGSGNIGATNVLRTGNRAIAAATLLCDALKGTVAVLLMNALSGTTAGLIAGAAAFLGHLFPVWLKFKGGKGVATYIGVLFGVAWPLGFAFLAVWLGMAILFKRSSLAALAASALGPVWAWLGGRTELVLPLVAFAVVIWLTHRANIARLIKGEEPRIELGGKR
jgi:glycerol-3-phosphate acyltransferase PlsY